ncbi:TIGR03086 family metal-binding protein [Geodermatophilus sp. SYSU D01176]
MTATAAPPLTADVALFARAAGYALEGLAEVTVADLDRPTPCAGWPVRTLLLHLADAADGLTGLARTGDLDLPSPPRTGDADPSAVARDRLLHLLDVLTSAAARDGQGSAEGAARTQAAARGGAVELAVHGWDVATACGSGRGVPPDLAAALLRTATSLVDDGARPGRFSAPVDLPPDAHPGDRLVAFLGRRPTARP